MNRQLISIVISIVIAVFAFALSQSIKQGLTTSYGCLSCPPQFEKKSDAWLPFIPALTVLTTSFIAFLSVKSRRTDFSLTKSIAKYTSIAVLIVIIMMFIATKLPQSKGSVELQQDISPREFKDAIESTIY